MRRFLLLPLLLSLTASIATASTGPRPAIHATRIPLDSDNPSRRPVGRLRYLAGWELRSPDPRFGGISALARDGSGFVALGDTGHIIRFALDRRGRVTEASIAALPAGPGRSDLKSDRDAEAMTRDPRTGRIWVSFENTNAIWRYAPGFVRGEGGARPEAMRRWPANGGAETLVRLRDGRFVVLAEEAVTAPGVNVALLFASDPVGSGKAPVQFGYRPPEGYVPTDAVELPIGRLLVLNRRYRVLEGVSAILTVVDLRALRAGTVLTGREIATLRPPLTVDNMEALAVEQAGGRTILWIASDNNFSGWQRTLLLKFALPGDL